MRLSSTQTLILVLSAFVAFSSPSLALRGEPGKIARSLQEEIDATAVSKDAKDKDKADKEDMADKEDKSEKEDKDSKKGSKKDKDSSKEEKNACKRAKKESSKKSKRSRRHHRERRRMEEVSDEAGLDGTSVVVEDLEYCSQGDLSPVQCANLEALPYDGRMESSIALELVHDNTTEAETMAQQAEAILDGRDTKSRFVGCTEMDAPPVRRRHLEDVESNHEIAYVTEDEKINVTGVDFQNLVIQKGGCQNNVISNGMVCDMIKSKVHIFYTGGDPTDEDMQDMENLLVETIMNQANAGAFGGLGSVESVAVDGGANGSTNSSGDSGGTSFVVYIAAALVAVLVVLGIAYCCCLKKGVSTVRSTEKNEETSDEELNTSDEDEPAHARAVSSQMEVPMAQVVAIEEPQPKANTPKAKKQEQPESGGWFEWVSNTDDQSGKRKKEAEKTDMDKKAEEWSWW